MSEFKWWQTGVVYQIYPRSFMDSNGDGIGDLQGIISKLDYLADLGIDTIWISPIFKSPMKDFGYDVADYVDVDPMFGDLAIMDELVAEAHARNLKVILDYVPNHTSDEHAWFIESRASRDSAKRDWYIWADAKLDGSPPNNWISFFGGPAWEWDEVTGQYYLHLFVPGQPDLNWRNPDVREAMYNVLRFWMERGIDGFRMDVVAMLLKDPKLRDNPGRPASPATRHELQQRIYNTHRPDIHPIMREIRQVIDEYDDRVSIGEIYLRPLSHWIKFYGTNNDELHMPFNFELLNQPWTAVDMRNTVESLEHALPDGAWPNYVLGNHDQKRIASRFGKDAVRLAAMMLLTLRGTPTMYMGEEIGMPDGYVPNDRLVDPPALNLGPEFGRDGCRTPIQWSAEPFAGFSTVEPWLPVDEGYLELNVEAQLQNPTSVLSLYKQLLALRHAHPALNRGTYEGVNNIPDACFVYLREHEGQRILIALNFTDQQHILGIEHVAETGKLLLSTELNRSGEVDLSELELRPNEGLMIEL